MANGRSDVPFPETLSMLMGLVSRESENSYALTVDQLLAGLKRRNIPLLARIDHAAAARSASMALLPTEVFIFGNAILGTPLMQAAHSIAIDLPLKILVCEDARGCCWSTYSDPAWIARRHDIVPSAYPVLKAMREVLEALCSEAGSAP